MGFKNMLFELLFKVKYKLNLLRLSIARLKLQSRIDFSKKEFILYKHYKLYIYVCIIYFNKINIITHLVKYINIL